MDIRGYDPATDADAAIRIWHEVGWIDRSDDDHRTGTLRFVNGGRARVGVLDGNAESLVSMMPGRFRYLDEELPAAIVAAVTTSHVARRQGLAGRVLADAIGVEAADGAAVAVLGAFEQGFYNRLGFGTGTPTRWRTFDPASLRVPVRHRPPVRLTPDDWADMHANRMSAMSHHGMVLVAPPEALHGETLFSENGFGLGYRDASGTLTHHAWFEAKDLEHGPLTVTWMSYQDSAGLLEMLSLVASLGDQFHAVKVQEPVELELQDLIDHPFRGQLVTKRSEFAASIEADAYWQIRICDLDACVAAMDVASEVRFNLHLTDPIVPMLAETAPWQGIDGTYVVELSPAGCGVTAGQDPALLTVDASVGALSRWWAGVTKASALSLTDALSAPAELLTELDRVVIPRPFPVWDF